jgi:hypothetical protein
MNFVLKCQINPITDENFVCNQTKFCVCVCVCVCVCACARARALACVEIDSIRTLNTLK